MRCMELEFVTGDLLYRVALSTGALGIENLNPCHYSASSNMEPIRGIYLISHVYL